MDQTELFRRIVNSRFSLRSLPWLDLVENTWFSVQRLLDLHQRRVLLYVERWATYRSAKRLFISLVCCLHHILWLSVGLLRLAQPLFDLLNLYLYEGCTHRNFREWLVTPATQASIVKQSSGHTIFHARQIALYWWVSLTAVHQWLKSTHRIQLLFLRRCQAILDFMATTMFEQVLYHRFLVLLNRSEHFSTVGILDCERLLQSVHGLHSACMAYTGELLRRAE